MPQAFLISWNAFCISAETRYRAMRHIGRTQVLCSTLNLLHDFLLKSIPI